MLSRPITPTRRSATSVLDEYELDGDLVERLLFSNSIHRHRANEQLRQLSGQLQDATIQPAEAHAPVSWCVPPLVGSLNQCQSSPSEFSGKYPDNAELASSQS